MSARYIATLEKELGLSQEAFGQLLEAKQKVEEKVEKATEDLRRECFSRYFDLCSVRHMLSIWLCCLQSINTRRLRNSRCWVIK